MEIQTVDSFLAYLSRIRERTDRVVGLIPPDRLEWRPADGAFSFGDLLRHMAALERHMFAENVRGRPSRYPGHGPDLASGHREVMAFWRRCREESMEIFRQLSDDDLTAACTTPAGATLSTWKWLRALVEHEVHHRGQIYLMLRLVGVDTPPLYGLTSEEVLERSVEPG